MTTWEKVRENGHLFLTTVLSVALWRLLAFAGNPAEHHCPECATAGSGPEAATISPPLSPRFTVPCFGAYPTLPMGFLSASLPERFPAVRRP